MTDEEIADFLDQETTVICASSGRDGWPHLMPLWYVVRAGELWAWTYAASQKVRNLERDDRATLQVEAGGRYDELRGVMIKARVRIGRDPDEVAKLGEAIFRRHAGPQASLGQDVLDAIQKQAGKRVTLQFVAHEVATWDHRKLGGVY
jgi:nitroimidazol reductase NimA-like FMN-containing flavoprotein (pyridoxamine 5'-phosphate oxidase superfamily)